MKTLPLLFPTLLLAAAPLPAQDAAKAGRDEHLDPPLTFYAGKHPWSVPAELSKQQMAAHQRTPDWNADEANVRPYMLPELFTLRDGTRVETAAQWQERRRPELLESFRSEVFGQAPPRPADLAFRVVETDPAALARTATRKKIALSFTIGGAPFTFHVHLFVPRAAHAAAPVFLLLNHRGTGAPDPVALSATGYWPVADAIGRGYAMAVIYTAAEVDPDGPNAATGVRAFYSEHASEPQAFTWGALGAWAWSASRAMDYFETDRDLDARRVAVIGQSRGGKTALWAGAQDERFALTCSNCSGEGGAALARRNFGETLGQLTRAFPYWFTPRYATYAERIDALPVDAHELISLVAPRGYHGTDASLDLHADPRGSWLALLEASKVWALLGQGEPLKDEMPMVNDLLLAGRLAYHMREGEHDLKRFDWKLYFDHADALWPRREP